MGSFPFQKNIPTKEVLKGVKNLNQNYFITLYLNELVHVVTEIKNEAHREEAQGFVINFLDDLSKEKQFQSIFLAVAINTMSVAPSEWGLRAKLGDLSIWKSSRQELLTWQMLKMSRMLKN